MTRFTDRTGRQLALALTLLAFGLFMIGVDAKSIWWDESLSLFRAQQSLSYIITNRLDIGQTLTIDQHPPFYFVVLHGAIHLFGESDLALRLPSVLFATLTVPLLYALGRRMANVQTGLLAGLFAALSPLFLWYAQEVRMYTLVTALGALGTYSLWRAIDEHSPLWALVFIATILLGLGTLYFYGLLIGVQLLFGLALIARRARMRIGTVPRWVIGVLLAGAITLGALLAWLAPPQIRALLQDPLPGREYIPLGEMLLDSLNAFSLGLSVDPVAMWPAQLLYLVIYLLGLVAAWRLPRPPSNGSRRWAVRGALLILLLGFPVLPLVFFWLVSLFKPLYMGSRYITLFSPSFYLALGLGVSFLWARNRWLGMALTLALAAGMVYSAVGYHTDFRYVKEDYHSAAQHVLQRELPGDAIVLTAPENLFAFEHYYRGHLGIAPLPQPALALPDPVALDRALRILAEGHERLWLVHCRTQWSDPQDLVLDWMNRHLLLLERTIYPSYGADMTVYLFNARPPVLTLPDEITLIATCNQGLSLVDWSVRYLDAKGSPVTVNRGTWEAAFDTLVPVPGGGAVAVGLRWHVLAPLDGYKLSLRLMDQAGRMWAQRDDRPLYYMPTETWEVGSMIEHDVALTVPVGSPPGTYTLVMVPYREVDGQALTCSPMQDGEVSLTLGQIVVGETPPHLMPASRELAPREHLLPWPLALGPLRLMGRSLSMPHDRAVSPGESLELALWWLAERPTRGEYDLVIHWTQGRTVAHRDVFPLGGPQEHRPLLTRQSITVPDTLPPGDYSLRMLLYDRERGAFARVRMGPVPWLGGSIGVGSVTVQ